MIKESRNPASETLATFESQGLDACVAAIQFALTNDEGMAFLRCWNEGEFDRCHKWWPEAPDTCYIGADPLFTPSVTKEESSS